VTDKASSTPVAIPTVDAWMIAGDKGAYCLVFYCEHCRRWHTHGCGAGHRAAHCLHPSPGSYTLRSSLRRASLLSPYLGTGYNLRNVGALSPENRKRYNSGRCRV